MADQKTINAAATATAYQIVPMNGGFQAIRLTLDEKGMVTKREPVTDPDAWDQTISAMEVDISKKFQ
jgi:hypothetical protein